MSSPTTPRGPRNRGALLLLQDEPPLAPIGHGALASLIRQRGREDEDGLGGDSPEDELPRRDERRLSAILNSANIRSMRLIGSSNPRYCWERYWKTEDELATMPKNVFVTLRPSRSFLVLTYLVPPAVAANTTSASTT